MVPGEFLGDARSSAELVSDEKGEKISIWYPKSPTVDTYNLAEISLTNFVETFRTSSPTA